MQTDSKPRRMSYVGIAVVTICVLLPLVMALGLAVLIFGLRNTQNSQQASAYFKMQQMENLRESQLYLAELNKKQNAKQLAAVERETEEVEDQIELSKDWTLTFPENVQDIEFAGATDSI